MFAEQRANARALRSRNGAATSMLAWLSVSHCLRLEQIAGSLHISHETVYRYIHLDKKAHGRLYLHLHCQKPYRKRRRVAATATGVARWPTKGV